MDRTALAGSAALHGPTDLGLLWRLELSVFVFLITLFNLPLLFGHPATNFMFFPAAVETGEWWRLLAHPFVHVSWYHLFLDAAAFFLAYIELRHRKFAERLAICSVAGAGSLMAALVVSPLVATHGLCGLSGMAHGLTALVGLETMRLGDDRLVRLGGAVCFFGVVAKSVVEAMTGHILFASWHLGSLGLPIAACHAGGVLGAVLGWLCLFARQPQHPETGVLGPNPAVKRRSGA